MGIERKWFKDSIPTILLCSICNEVAYPPVKTECEHLFCSFCLSLWLSSNTTCPCDRNVLSKDIKIDEFLRRMIGEFIVTCIKKEDGCTWEGPYSNFGDHYEKCNFCKDIKEGEETPQLPIKGDFPLVVTKEELAERNVVYIDSHSPYDGTNRFINSRYRRLGVRIRMFVFCICLCYCFLFVTILPFFAFYVIPLALYGKNN